MFKFGSEPYYRAMLHKAVYRQPVSGNLHTNKSHSHFNIHITPHVQPKCVFHAGQLVASKLQVKIVLHDFMPLTKMKCFND